VNVSMSVSPIKDHRGEVIGASTISSDITDRKQAERELALARDAAVESARLKGAFIRNMSHEIRTPLNIILGYSELISDELSRFAKHEGQPLIDVVESAGRRLLATIDAILNISKIETGNFEVQPTELKLRTVLERQAEDVRPLAEKAGLSLSCSIAEPDATVRFDEYCLSQALLNLLHNSIKFTRLGGVSLTLDRDEEGLLCLSIRDTGVGIDPTYLPYLFEPFSQEDVAHTRRFEGTGLGLAITKQYLELNDARISVESEKGKGSVFRIHFSKASEVVGRGGPGLRRA